MKFSQLLNKSIVFFYPQKADYWNTITPCNIASKPCKLNKYYLNFESKAKYPDRFDANKIPLYWYRNDYIYHPIVIAQYALGLFEAGKNNDFLLQADWFVKNGVETRCGLIWEIGIDVHEYKIKAPWISAMAQGEAISVLTRAYLISNNEKYLTSALAALIPFTQHIDEGGVLNEFAGSKVYEEYPAEKPTAVLNGFIFSLFGLYDLVLLGNSVASELFEQGINSLKTILPFYDMEYWSSYDLYSYPQYFPSTYTYHIIHAEQLKAMYILTGVEIFNHFAVKWNEYSKSYYNKSKVLITKYYLGIKTKLSSVNQKNKTKR